MAQPRPAEGTQPILEVQGLTVRFGQLTVFDGINLRVQPGERRGIIGPNGAGKTTFFNAISGEVRPAAGRILYQGQDITHLPPHRRAALGISRTFQKTTLFPRLRVIDNLLLSLMALTPHRFQMFRPRSHYRQYMDEAYRLLAEAGLEDVAEVPIKDLAYGQQRQIEILMAIGQNPRLLLLDEPTAGLAPADVPLITRLLARYERKITMLLIEHHMDLVFDVVDKITVLHAGQVFLEGTPADIRGNEKVRQIYLGGAVSSGVR